MRIRQVLIYMEYMTIFCFIRSFSSLSTKFIFTATAIIILKDEANNTVAKVITVRNLVEGKSYMYSRYRIGLITLFWSYFGINMNVVGVSILFLYQEVSVIDCEIGFENLLVVILFFY